MADLVEIPVTHNGVTMHAVAVGAGPPVVLVHGFAQSHLTWRANFDALAAHYRVLAVDLPGFGASTKVALDGLEAFGDTLLRLLDREHLDSAHVVGHSYGGLVALGLALHRPARVRSLTVLGPAGLGPTVTDFREQIALARTPAEIKAAIRRAFRDPDRFNAAIDGFVQGQLAYRAQPGVMELLAELSRCSDAWMANVEARVEELKMPMLVLWGAEDGATPASQAERVRGLPNAEVHLFPGAGHAAQVEAAEAFNAKLLSFLDAQSGN